MHVARSAIWESVWPAYRTSTSRVVVAELLAGQYAIKDPKNLLSVFAPATQHSTVVAMNVENAVVLESVKPPSVIPAKES